MQRLMREKERKRREVYKVGNTVTKSQSFLITYTNGQSKIIQEQYTMVSKGIFYTTILIMKMATLISSQTVIPASMIRSFSTMFYLSTK